MFTDKTTTKYSVLYFECMFYFNFDSTMTKLLVAEKLFAFKGIFIFYNL